MKVERRIWLLLSWAVLLGPVCGQEVPPATNEAGAAASLRLGTSLQSLEALSRTIQSNQAEIMRVQTELREVPDEVTQDELLAQLKELKGDADELNRQFQEFAVAVDLAQFVDAPQAEFNWQEEVGSILQPIISEVKSATAESRLIGDLRNSIDRLGQRLQTAEEGVANLEKLLAADPTPELRSKLEKEHAVWTRRRDDVENQRTAMQLQLENRLSERKSLLDSTTGYAKLFVRTRGRNLVLGMVVFCAVFFGIRLVEKVYQRVWGGGDEKSFGSRLISLVFHAMSIFGGLIGTLVVFNQAGDWFLLGLVFIFLLGVGWAGINTLPQHVETVKLILNIGSVREGERMMFEGVPWKVDRLHFEVRLVNPLLEGGRQRLPVRYLIGLHSRSCLKREDWFPCRAGDWVELGDGTRGRIAYQTPNTVQLVEPGGAQRVYPTADFLGQCPRNLSSGFRVSVTFGIDYRHQALCTTEIPRAMQAAVATGLAERFDTNWIRQVAVHFREAGASSLDFRADVDWAGEAAVQYGVLPLAITRCLVDACNHHGWTIPFPQLTVHRAGE